MRTPFYVCESSARSKANCLSVFEHWPLEIRSVTWLITANLNDSNGVIKVHDSFFSSWRFVSGHPKWMYTLGSPYISLICERVSGVKPRTACVMRRPSSNLRMVPFLMSHTPLLRQTPSPASYSKSTTSFG